MRDLKLRGLLSDYDYLAFSSEGEAVAICVDDKHAARSVKEWMDMGRTIQRLPHKEACAILRADWEKCKARKKAAEEAAE